MAGNEKIQPVRFENIDDSVLDIFQPFEKYKTSLLKFIDVKLIGNFKGKILVDPMNGSGSDYFVDMLKEMRINCIQIRNDRDPMFSGVNPEPIESNLKETIRACRKEKPTLAVVFDGDCDRIGALDERGRFFNSQQIYSTVAWHFLKNKGKRGGLAKTVSTTHHINRLAEKYSAKVFEVPIGFKHIAKKMINGEVFLGGEESGGIGFAEHLPERDPILISLFLIELIARESKGLSELYKMICKEVGPAVFLRKDYRINDSIRSRINSRLESSPPEKIGPYKVESISTLDGFKFILSDLSWMLIRTSGTEPLLRIYAEAETQKEALSIIKAAESLVNV